MQTRRIAILKPSALGDIVHSLPVLTALREEFPHAHITWIVNKAYEPLIAGHPHLNETLTFDRGVFKKSSRQAVLYSLKFVDELRRRRFDLVIDLQGLLRTGLMCAATGAPVRIGFANAREGSRHFYTQHVDVSDADRIHAIDRYWRIVEFLGAGKREKQFLVPIKPEARQEVREELAALPRPWMFVAVGSRWITKCWPPAHFTELLKQAQKQFGGSVHFVGTADDTGLSQQVAQGLSGSWKDYTGQTTLPRLAALLAAADVMVANDTGPLHLAAALGRPCVAPYTCTKVVLHGPYGSMSGGVETTVPCRGSYLKQCPHGLICMTDLNPDRLWSPLAEVLSRWKSP